jgi:hypothetical protein
MEKPEHLVLKKRANYRIGCGVGVVCLLFLGLVVVVGYLTGAQPDELALPAVALGSMGAIVVVILFAGVAITVLWERGDIKRLLNGTLWAEWQYAPDDWQRIVQQKLDAESQIFKPWYNLIIGPIIGVVIAGVALFGIKDPQITPIMLLVAGGVTLLFILSGVITPLVLRSNRQARYRKRLKVESPRVYIGPMGMYHETEGYTSLDRLGGVDYIPSDAAITFQVYHRSERYGTFRFPVSVEVPRGREADAEALANRFHQERRMEQGRWLPW